tara:strand:- start:974 stop:1180 length:207 start_codon:yes stop_codon:yes gene_type:complete
MKIRINNPNLLKQLLWLYKEEYNFNIIYSDSNLNFYIEYINKVYKILDILKENSYYDFNNTKISFPQS